MSRKEELLLKESKFDAEIAKIKRLLKEIEDEEEYSDFDFDDVIPEKVTQPTAQPERVLERLERIKRIKRKEWKKSKKTLFVRKSSRTKRIRRDQNLHVVFLCEVTGSMKRSYKEWRIHITKMVPCLRKMYDNFHTEVAFVGYGEDSSKRVQFMDFQNVGESKLDHYLMGVKETCEDSNPTSDVIGGIRKVLDLGFDQNYPSRMLIHMSATPASEYKNEQVKGLLEKMAMRRIFYFFHQVGRENTEMINAFKGMYEKEDMEVNVFNSEDDSDCSSDFLKYITSLICKSITKSRVISRLEMEINSMESDDDDMFDSMDDSDDEVEEEMKVREEELQDDENDDIDEDMRKRAKRNEMKEAKIHGLKVKARAKETRRRILRDQNVHLVFLCDVTGSMWNAINQCKINCIKIKDYVRLAYADFDMQVAFVGYRDFGDFKRFDIMEFDKPEKLSVFLEDVNADGGGDTSEDVFGGLEKVMKMKWDQDHPTRLLIHMADAPCHGREFHDGVEDNHPEGDPTGRDIKKLLGDLVDLRIHYFFIKIGNSTDKMIRKFKKVYERNEDDMELVVYDHEDDYLQLFVRSINWSIVKSQKSSKEEVQKKYDMI